MRLTAMLLLAGCGGQGQSTTSLTAVKEHVQDTTSGQHASESNNAQRPAGAPSDAQLFDALQAELELLGKDISFNGYYPPAGADEVVFDLMGSQADPAGVQTANGLAVILRWTERLVGDTDQNGEVSISDLAPMGQHWDKRVNYLSPEAASGVKWWPTGKPYDDYVGTPLLPPSMGSPAENWRLSRVDTDANGEIAIADLSPIGRHWRERLHGYRIYHQAPGENAYSLVTGLPQSAGSLTFARNTLSIAEDGLLDSQRPVRYSCLLLLEEPGQHSFYVVPFDSELDAEGPLSVTTSLEIVEAPDPLDNPWGDDPEVNHAPAATMLADPLIGAAPLEVQFDASGSSDVDGGMLMYSFDFNSDGTADAGPQLSPLAVNTYNIAANYTATVSVFDELGAVDTAAVDISASLSGNSYPQAVLVTDPAAGSTPLIVQFDASGSTDYDGTIVAYSFDFNGDGTVDLEGPEAIGTHTFDEPGEYTALLIVEDDGGLSNGTAADISVVYGNYPPNASLSLNPASIREGEQVELDASLSEDSDGSVVQYEWDFDGDGEFDQTGTEPLAAHYYPVPGDYLPAVQVTDNEGAVGSATAALHVIANIAPTAQFTFSPPPDRAAQSIDLDASSSSDADGDIVQFKWDFDNDGMIDRSRPVESPVTTYRFKTPGDHAVRLQAIDNEGGVGETIQVLHFEPNQLPVAALSATPEQGEAPLAVLFDASGSTDPEDDELVYAWDFYGTGNFTPPSAFPLRSHTYYMQGAFQATVQVTDAKDGVSTAQFTIDVQNGWYTVTVDTGVQGGFGGDDVPILGFALVNGTPAISYVKGWELDYSHGLDAQGLAWDTPLMLGYGNEGHTAPAIIDTDGLAGVCSAPISGIRLYRADDATGDSFSNVYPMDNLSGMNFGISMTHVNGNPAAAWMDSLGQLKFGRATNPQGTAWATPIIFQDLNPDFRENRCELIYVNNVPCVAFRHSSLDKINYYYSTDASGDDWIGPLEVTLATPMDEVFSLAAINNVAMLCYNSETGLVIQIAPGGLADAWSEPILVSPDTFSFLSMHKVNGVPAIATSGSRYYEAKDLLGTAWNPYEIADGLYWASQINLLELNGKPALAHVSGSNVLRYAIRNPD